ncbi:MAG: hypothetical protein ACRYGM_24730 [Janthinobacterium lividum]
MSSPSPAPGPTEDDAAFYRAALHDMIGLAADLARRIHAAAIAAPAIPLPGSPAPRSPAADGPAANSPPALSLEQASIALDRTARIVRRCVLLAQRLHQPQPACAPTPAPEDAEQARTAARAKIIRGVEDAIHRATRDAPARQPALAAELSERLDHPEFADDLVTRPVAELIEEIARDLGIAMQGRSFVWCRRTPADLADLAARARGPARAPGSAPGQAQAPAPGQAQARPPAEPGPLPQTAGERPGERAGESARPPPRRHPLPPAPS